MFVAKHPIKLHGVLLRLHNLIPASAKLHIVKFAIYYLILHIFGLFGISVIVLMPGNYNDSVQEWALHTIYCDNKATYEELLQRAKLPPVHMQQLKAIAIIINKVKISQASSYILDLFYHY